MITPILVALETQKTVLQADLEVSQKEVYKVEKAKIEAITSQVKTLFPEDVKIEVYNERIQFLAEQEGTSYDKEIFTLYVERLDYSSTVYDNVRINYYTTCTNSEFEIDRLILLGKIAEIVKTKKELILNVYNENCLAFKEELSSIRKNSYKLEDEIKTLETEIKKIKLDELLQDLTNGVVFLNPTLLWINSKNRFNIKTAKVVKLNKIKGTVKISVEREYYNEPQLVTVNLNDILELLRTNVYSLV